MDDPYSLLHSSSGLSADVFFLLKRLYTYTLLNFVRSALSSYELYCMVNRLSTEKPERGTHWMFHSGLQNHFGKLQDINRRLLRSQYCKVFGQRINCIFLTTHNISPRSQPTLHGISRFLLYMRAVIYHLLVRLVYILYNYVLTIYAYLSGCFLSIRWYEEKSTLYFYLSLKTYFHENPRDGDTSFLASTPNTIHHSRLTDCLPVWFSGSWPAAAYEKAGSRDLLLWAL